MMMATFNTQHTQREFRFASMLICLCILNAYTDVSVAIEEERQGKGNIIYGFKALACESAFGWNNNETDHKFFVNVI